MISFWVNYRIINFDTVGISFHTLWTQFEKVFDPTQDLMIELMCKPFKHVELLKYFWLLVFKIELHHRS